MHVSLVKTLMVMIVLVGVSVSMQAREGRGSWDRESKAESLMKLIDMLKLEQDERVARLEKEAKELVPELAYPNFDKFGAAAAGRDSIRDRFLKGRLNVAQKKAFVTGLCKDLQDNQTRLYAAEKQAAAVWEPEDKSVENSEKEFTAEIFGQKVTAMRLGVILDVSHSMEPYKDALQKTISGQFPYCYFAEVDGCRIIQLGTKLSREMGKKTGLEYWENREASWFFADPGVNQNPFLPHWHSPEKLNISEKSYGDWYRLSRHNYSALTAMSHLLEVDSIYWFSDFQDETSPRLRKHLVKMLDRKKVKLFLRSHDKRPHADLVKYARKSGGGYERKKIKLEN